MTTYGERLRRVLDAKGVSVRQLAHKMNPDKPELARRQLYRVLSGDGARTHTKKAIAEALGVDRREIEDGEDGEDDIVADLLERVDELTRQANELRRVAERVERKRA